MPDNFDLVTHDTEELDGWLVAFMQDGDNHNSNVLESDETNILRIRWGLTGTLLPVLSGSWELQAVFESIGPGSEFTLPAAPVAIPWDATGRYNETIPIPPGTVDPNPYKIVVMLSHMNPAGDYTQMAGFVEIPMVRFR